MRAPVVLSTLFAVLVPATAIACPYCAGRADGGIFQAIALSLFVMSPFLVAYVVARIVRSGERSDADPHPVATSDGPHATHPVTRREAE